MLRVDDIPKEGILFYDIETDSKHPAYANLKMIGYQLGLESSPRIVDLKSKSDRLRFRDRLRDPQLLKVSFNGINYDDIVLSRYGFYVEPKRRHDMFLALKTVAPGLQAFSLKYANWYYLLDDHDPEGELEDDLLKRKLKAVEICRASPKVLAKYCQHDVTQTANLFTVIWEIVQRPEHWKVYRKMELAMAEPLHEMVLFAGEWLSIKDIEEKIQKLGQELQQLSQEIHKLSNGEITNPASWAQTSQYVHDTTEIELAITKAGNYTLRKEDLVELSPQTPLAEKILSFRDGSKLMQYYVSHLNAAKHEQSHHLEDHPKRKGDLLPLDHRVSFSMQSHFANGNDNGHTQAIPKAYTMSSARTRRFQSSSNFGINFQNQNKRTKLIHLVPEGWLGCWIDSRQIENVVHIHTSQDMVRREAYEADPDWNEYVWLCNQILETEHSRKELEEIESPMNPQWSIYKTYKMIKLALNFFMGAPTFAKKTGLSLEAATRLFDKVHRACPAIRKIVGIVQEQFEENDGYIRDVFGHIYGKGTSILASKNIHQLCIYLVQGCGTGSVPKAMTVANYQTLHSLDSTEPFCEPNLYHPFKKRYSYGIISGTTHDECAFRISLGLPIKKIVELIKGCLYNMEEKFSPLFDGIPLRAQLSVSLTNAGDQIELDHRKPDFERRLIDDFIRIRKKSVVSA